MSHFSAGIVLTGSDGYVHVRIWDKSYFICPEEMGMLLFVGETVSLFRQNPDPSGNPVAYGLGLVAAVSWALYSNLTRRWGESGGGGAVLHAQFHTP